MASPIGVAIGLGIIIAKWDEINDLLDNAWFKVRQYFSEEARMLRDSKAELEDYGTRLETAKANYAKAQELGNTELMAIFEDQITRLEAARDHLIAGMDQAKADLEAERSKHLEGMDLRQLGRERRSIQDDLSKVEEEMEQGWAMVRGPMGMLIRKRLEGEDLERWQERHANLRMDLEAVTAAINEIESSPARVAARLREEIEGLRRDISLGYRGGEGRFGVPRPLKGDEEERLEDLSRQYFQVLTESPSDQVVTELRAEVDWMRRNISLRDQEGEGGLDLRQSLRGNEERLADLTAQLQALGPDPSGEVAAQLQEEIRQLHLPLRGDEEQQLEALTRQFTALNQAAPGQAIQQFREEIEQLRRDISLGYQEGAGGLGIPKPLRGDEEQRLEDLTQLIQALTEGTSGQVAQQLRERIEKLRRDISLGYQAGEVELGPVPKSEEELRLRDLERRLFQALSGSGEVVPEDIQADMRPVPRIEDYAAEAERGRQQQIAEERGWLAQFQSDRESLLERQEGLRRALADVQGFDPSEVSATQESISALGQEIQLVDDSIAQATATIENLNRASEAFRTARELQTDLIAVRDRIADLETQEASAAGHRRRRITDDLRIARAEEGRILGFIEGYTQTGNLSPDVLDRALPAAEAIELITPLRSSEDFSLPTAPQHPAVTQEGGNSQVSHATVNVSPGAVQITVPDGSDPEAISDAVSNGLERTWWRSLVEQKDSRVASP